MTDTRSSVVPLPVRRFIRRLATGILAVVAFVAGVWLERVPLLRETASLWIVSDPVTVSDAAAVLGGDIEVRPVVAAELYKKGLVTKVLVSQVPVMRSVLTGMIPEHTELNCLVLLKLGVPKAAIETFGQANESTKDEAVSLREWAEAHHVSHIIIPTEIFAARRVRWIFDREFAGSGIQLEVSSYDGPNYTRRAWWRTEAGVINFQNEIIKYLYYRLKY